jgi:hypothetical protein
MGVSYGIAFDQALGLGLALGLFLVLHWALEWAEKRLYPQRFKNNDTQAYALKNDVGTARGSRARQAAIFASYVAASSIVQFFSLPFWPAMAVALVPAAVHFLYDANVLYPEFFDSRRAALAAKLRGLFAGAPAGPVSFEAFHAEAAQALARRRQSEEGRRKLMNFLGAQNFDERIGAALKDRRPLAIELSENLLSGADAPLTARDQETLEYLASIARRADSLKTPLGLITPAAVSPSRVAETLAARNPALAALSGRFYLMEKDAARPRPGAQHSMEKLLSLAEESLGARGGWAGKMDVYLKTPDEWTIEDSVKEMVSVILRLAGDMSYDALDAVERGLKAFREAAEAA